MQSKQATAAASSSLRVGATTEDNGFVPERLTEPECLYDRTMSLDIRCCAKPMIHYGHAVASTNGIIGMILSFWFYKALLRDVDYSLGVVA